MINPNAKAQQIKDEASALLTYANGITSASDLTLGDAVRTLAEGYGQGGGEEDYDMKEWHFITSKSYTMEEGGTASSWVGGTYDGTVYNEYLLLWSVKVTSTAYVYAGFGRNAINCKYQIGYPKAPNTTNNMLKGYVGIKKCADIPFANVSVHTDKVYGAYTYHASSYSVSETPTIVDIIGATNSSLAYVNSYGFYADGTWSMNDPYYEKLRKTTSYFGVGGGGGIKDARLLLYGR